MGRSGRSSKMQLLATATLLVAAHGHAGALRKGKAIQTSRGKMGHHSEALLFNRQAVRSKTTYRTESAMEVIHKTAYWGTVKMGTPAQEFKVIFDTGSGNLILPAKSCDMPGCNTHKKYDSTTSHTAAMVTNEKGEGSTEISFGTGDIAGDYFKDQFCIADNLCTEVRFVAATQQSPEPFSETPFDGILGLGFKDLSMGEHFNIVDDLNDAGQMPGGQFAVFLTDDGASEITFGGYKPENIASDIVWANVVRESYWQVGVEDITFDGKDTGLCPGGCQVAVDTGTSMLAGPSDLVDKLTAKLGAKEDCSNMASLPNLGFRIGDRVLNLSPEDYMDQGEGNCDFSLMSLDVPPPKGPLFIFGDPFLRRFVTVFDRKESRVGFGVAKHRGESGDMGLAADAGAVSSGAQQGGASASAVDLHLDSGVMGADSGSSEGSSDGSSASDSSAPATTAAPAAAQPPAAEQPSQSASNWQDVDMNKLFASDSSAVSAPAEQPAATTAAPAAAEPTTAPAVPDYMAAYAADTPAVPNFAATTAAPAADATASGWASMGNDLEKMEWGTPASQSEAVVDAAAAQAEKAASAATSEAVPQADDAVARMQRMLKQDSLMQQQESFIQTYHKAHPHLVSVKLQRGHM